MKHIWLFLLLIVVTCNFSCENHIGKREEIVWKRFPYERFFSYSSSSISTIQKLSFVSENNDYLEIPINYKDSFNRYVWASTIIEGYGFRGSTGEVFYSNIASLDIYNNAKFGLNGEVYNRYFLGFWFEIKEDNVQQSAKFSVTVPYDSEYMPYNPDSIATYLSDTISLYDERGKDVVKLVAGKGIVSFIDKQGIKWQIR